MIELKLQAAADKLPDHHSNFQAVEARSRQKKQPRKSPSRKRLAIAMVLAALLVGCVAVTTPDYHLYNGNWWLFSPIGYDLAELFQPQDNQAQAAAKKLGITLPETLGGYPVIDYGRWNLTNQEVPIWWAWLSPRYVYHTSFYGVETEKPFLAEDGTLYNAHTLEGADVTYGSTGDAIWRRQFGYDENDVFTAGNWTLDNHTVVEITSLEYESITIYIAQIDLSSYLQPNWDVTWVDYGKGVVFSLEDDAQTPDALIGYAKEIIDLNN